MDILTSGVDAAIRSNFLLSPDTHAVAVGPELKMTIVASADYLAKHRRPKKPGDIPGHDAISYAFGSSGQLASWSFEGPDGAYQVQPMPRMVANDMRSLLQYARQGLGLAYVYREIAAPLIARDDVKEVLADHLPDLPRYSLNYLSKRNMSRRLKAFVDFAKVPAVSS